MHFSPSCIDIMAGFHAPGGPNFPNQGNGVRIEEDPEDIMEESPKRKRLRKNQQKKRKKRMKRSQKRS